MKKLLTWCFALTGLLIILGSCATVEPTDPNQALLANKEWHTDGLYMNVATDGTGGAKVIAPNVRFNFKKTLINTTAVNGQDLGPAAIWTLSKDAKTLTIYYPTYGSIGASIASQSLKVVKLTATELWVTTPSENDIQLLGIINLSPTSNYRFTTTAPTSTMPSASETLLKAIKWTGTGTNAGVFVGVAPNPLTKQSDANVDMKFETFFGINYITVSSTPAPVTWMLSSDGTTLTMAYPKIASIPAKAYTFTISKLTATELNFKKSAQATEDTSFSTLFTLSGSAELRMIPKP